MSDNPMIDPTALRTLCEQATKGEADWNESWNYFSEELLGECNVRFDVAHLRALLDENAALRERVEDLESELNTLPSGDLQVLGERLTSLLDSDQWNEVAPHLEAARVRVQSAESRLAALTAAGEKVVKHIEHYGSVRWDGHALDAFKAELRSDP